jgi:hypothetical protein
MSDDNSAPQDDDTTENQGQVDADEATDNADSGASTASPTGKATITADFQRRTAQDSGADPNAQRLFAQYGLNAQQARDILKNARDTLAQNAPGLENIAAAQAMSKPQLWGGMYANAMGAASDTQQAVLKQLMDYDLQGVSANKGSLDAQLALLKARYAGDPRVEAAEVRAMALPDQQNKGAAGTTEQYAEMLGFQKGTPEYKAFVEEQAMGGGNKLPPITKVNNPDGSQSLFMETRDENGVHLTPVHGTGTGSGPPRGSLQGDDFLATLPATQAAQVKALADGRMAFPSGFALKSPYWQNMLSSVSQYDPSFDAVNYNARAKTRSDFTSGKSANTIKALNTAIGHAGMLSDQIDNTASHDFTPLNAVQNYIAETSGSAGPTQFKQTAGALASELTNVFRGSGGAEADVKRYLEELNVNGSAEQKKAALSNIVGLMESRLEAVGDQYNKGMGKTEDSVNLLDPKAQTVFSRLTGRQAPTTGQMAQGQSSSSVSKYTEGQTATGPGGAKMVFTNGAWQPVGAANGKQ